MLPKKENNVPDSYIANHYLKLKNVLASYVANHYLKFKNVFYKIINNKIIDYTYLFVYPILMGHILCFLFEKCYFLLRSIILKLRSLRTS